jgi:hypothetical protein
MAGSLTYRRYTSDDGTDYAIRIDESNASSNVVGSAGELVPPRAGNYLRLPNYIKPRYVLAYREDDPRFKRKFVIGGTAGIASVFAPGAKITSQGTLIDDQTAVRDNTWVITSYRGEKQNFAPAFNAPDTGLIDGDTAQ